MIFVLKWTREVVRDGGEDVVSRKILDFCVVPVFKMADIIAFLI